MKNLSTVILFSLILVSFLFFSDSALLPVANAAESKTTPIAAPATPPAPKLYDVSLGKGAIFYKDER